MSAAVVGSSHEASVDAEWEHWLMQQDSEDAMEEVVQWCVQITGAQDNDAVRRLLKNLEVQKFRSLVRLRHLPEIEPLRPLRKIYLFSISLFLFYYLSCSERRVCLHPTPPFPPVSFTHHHCSFNLDHTQTI